MLGTIIKHIILSRGEQCLNLENDRIITNPKDEPNIKKYKKNYFIIKLNTMTFTY